MASQPSGASRGLFGLGHFSPPSSQPAPMFGGLSSQSTASSSGSSGGLFGSSTSQTTPQTSLFGTPQASPSRPFPSGAPTFQTTNGFGSSATPVSQPRGGLFGGPSIQTNQTQPNMFSNSRSPVTVTSPTPISRSSQPSVSSLGTSSPTRSSPTPAPRPSQSPKKRTGTPASSPNGTPGSGAQSPSEKEPADRPAKSHVDPHGDLCLEVGHLAAEFLVCSKAMARSSPFWRKMLYGEFAEGKRAQPQDGKSEWIVKLPEDNSAAMSIILNIIHSRFDQVSGYEDFVYTTHLYNLCVLTDKYDMTHILRPWARGWSRSTHAQCEKLGQSLRSKFCHERLWISWELGDHVTFDAMARALLLNSSAAAGNNLRYVGALEPPEIYESIQQARLGMIKQLLNPLELILQGLVQNDKSFCGRPESGSQKGECLASMLGTTIQSLHSNGLWPIPDPAAVQCSVWEFAAKLQCLVIEGKFGDYHKCCQSHGLKARIDNTLLSIPPLLNELHWRHLEAQAKKSGMLVLRVP
ncbi:hypothetical protein F4804DRAFT_82735 [Jackrogersella minutella]|nr:hypothetical protein F4804DRAFT_82735 [Jackrogersella minutella]